MESKNKLYKGMGFLLAVATVVGVVGITSFFGKKTPTNSVPNETLNNNPQDLPQVTTTDPSPAPVAPTTPETPPGIVSGTTTKKSVSVYKDGTYSATGSYMSPGGQDQLGVTVTLVNDIITSAVVTNGAGDDTSERYQQKFIAGYKQFVIGKNITDVNLTKVSGASLTPIGFNDALSQIKAKAKA